MVQESGLSGSEKQYVLQLVRNTLENLPSAGERLPAEETLLPGALPEKLERPSGVFVTLHRHGQLRGCVGFIEAVEPLFKAVIANTLNAARRDPRFPPVAPDEVPEMDIEVSVMSPLRKIGSVEEIEVGRDGLVVSAPGARGLLLPQVATEYNWDRMTFLEHTCQKAGLAPDAWRDSEVQVEIFSADVFGENE